MSYHVSEPEFVDDLVEYLEFKLVPETEKHIIRQYDRVVNDCFTLRYSEGWRGDDQVKEFTLIIYHDGVIMYSRRVRTFEYLIDVDEFCSGLTVESEVMRPY